MFAPLFSSFQRLLFTQLYPPPDFDKSSPDSSNSNYHRDLPGALNLLLKYIQMLSHHVLEVFPLATLLGEDNSRLYYNAANILLTEPIGVLLPEFVLCLTLLQVSNLCPVIVVIHGEISC